MQVKFWPFLSIKLQTEASWERGLIYRCPGGRERERCQWVGVMLPCSWLIALSHWNLESPTVWEWHHRASGWDVGAAGRGSSLEISGLWTGVCVFTAMSYPAGISSWRHLGSRKGGKPWGKAATEWECGWVGCILDVTDLGHCCAFGSLEDGFHFLFLFFFSSFSWLLNTSLIL